ncbi:MAG: hypothetical protein AB7V77_00585 [Candidatus Woesearchaeota archaeon]
MLNLKSKKIFLSLIIILSLLIVNLTFLFRFISNNPLNITKDYYGYEATNQSINLFKIIFSNFLFKIPFFDLIIPSIFLILSLILFSKILLIITKDEYEYYFSLILLSTLPMFILIHTGLTKMSFLLLLVLFIFYNYLKENNITFFSLIMLTTLFFPIITLFLIFPLLIFKPKNKELFLGSSISYIVPIFVILILNLSSDIAIFNTINSLSLFSFFGSSSGYSLIILIFGFLGLYDSSFLKDYKFQCILIFLYFIISLFNEYLRIIVALVFVFLSAKYLKKIIFEKWDLDILKYLTIILICCIIFFSISTTIQDNLIKYPNQNQVEALTFLKDIKDGLNQNYILTNQKYDFFIEYYSDLKPFNNQNSDNQKIANSIFYSRKYIEIKDLMIQNKISYILIDEKMKSGEIWPNDQEDLLFVIKYNNNFQKIYDKNNIQIYFFEVLN